MSSRGSLAKRWGRGGRLGRRQALADVSTAALKQTAEALPSEEQVDSAKTLEQLRAQESAILETQKRHEEALARLQARYQKVRRKMYRDHKKDVISSDNAELAKYQSGCAKPTRLSGLTKKEADDQARCLQAERDTVDESDLGQLMRRHLWKQPEPLPAEQCHAFRSVEKEQLKPAQQECLGKVGNAKWTAEGLVDADPADKAKCRRHWMGAAETRCLLAGHDLLFVGNSVVRRQMYTMLDLLAGPNAHRQLTDFTSVHLPAFKDEGARAGSSGAASRGRGRRGARSGRHGEGWVVPPPPTHVLLPAPHARAESAVPPDPSLVPLRIPSPGAQPTSSWIAQPRMRITRRGA